MIGLDAGAGGIAVHGPDPLPAQWRRGTPASLPFRDDTGRTRLAARFRTGDRARGTGLFREA